MQCNKCGNGAVKNSALGKDFYYCRTCKLEVEESTPYGSTTIVPPAQFNAYYNMTSPKASTKWTRLGPYDPGTYQVVKDMSGVWTATAASPYAFSVANYTLWYRGYFEIDSNDNVTIVPAWRNP